MESHIPLLSTATLTTSISASEVTTIWRYTNVYIIIIIIIYWNSPLDISDQLQQSFCSYIQL